MLVLHVRTPGAEDWVAAATRAGHLAALRLQAVSSIETGLARIAGGGVDAILLDLTGGGDSPDLGGLRQLRLQAGGIPILLAVSEGAAVPDIDERIVTKADALRLRELLRHAVRAGGARSKTAGPAIPEAKVIAFLGVKGGVGTTTAAVNVAAALASHYDVAITAIGSDLDMLGERLRRDAMPREQPLILQSAGATIEAKLWAVDKLPMLRVLTMPASAGPSAGFTADQVRSMLQVLRQHARVVILDLTFGGGDALRTAAQQADLTVLVVERTPTAVHAANKVFQTLLDWGTARNKLGGVLVNRCAISNPEPVETMKSRLPMPLFAVLPPAADMVVESETARKAVIALQPGSLVAQSFAALGEALEKKLSEGLEKKAGDFPRKEPAPVSAAGNRKRS